MKTYNVGFGGCRMGRHESDWDWFSMYKLVDAVVSGNFTNQETAAAGKVVPDRFVEQTAKLKAINFRTVDYVTIAYGTNDVWSNYAGDSANPDVLDATKYMSAVRYVVKTLLTAFPHLKIMLITPTFRNDLVPDSDSYTFCTDDKLTDFVNNLKVVGKELKVPVCDNYYEIGINKYNSTYYLSDGVHPTESGRMLIASKIAGQLLSQA
jgi:lysophospholipase L1-like esterase